MQVSLWVTISQNLPKFMSIELVMPCNSLYLESTPPQKIGTNELIYKTETESQMQKDNIGGGSVLMVERLGVN